MYFFLRTSWVLTGLNGGSREGMKLALEGKIVRRFLHGLEREWIQEGERKNGREYFLELGRRRLCQIKGCYGFAPTDRTAVFKL